jgi:hypothetical protein
MGASEATCWATRVLRGDEGSTRGRPTFFVSWVVLSRSRTAAALVSAMSTRVDAGTMAEAGVAAVSWARTAVALMSARSTSDDAGMMAAAGGEAAALLSAGSTGVEAGTVAAAGAVNFILTRALETWSTLSSGMADAFACSASMLLHVGGKETFEGWSPCFLSS